MLCKVRSTIERHAMLSPGDAVIVALSGGPDSMALLDILLTLKEEYNLKISAAHVNHCIRGDEADRDERFVREYCSKRNMKVFIKRADVPGICRQTGESIEQCARRIRYDFFALVGNNQTIATAHTLDDSLETAVFNLTRGTGIRGLCGIREQRGSIIRPLIDCSRNEVEAYCEQNGIPFVQDSSNLETVYARNKIRHTVVPALREINPSYLEVHRRCRDILSSEDDYLAGEATALAEKARQANGFDTATLAGGHIAVRRRALTLILKEASGIHPEFAQIERVDNILARGGSTEITGGFKVRSRHGLLEFPAHATQAWRFSITAGEHQVPSGALSVTWVDNGGICNRRQTQDGVLEYYLDSGAIIGGMVAGSRQAGDKIRFTGNKITKSLKKLFNEEQIAPEKRGIITIISDSNGPVCVEGFGVAQRCACRPDSNNIIKLTFRRNIHE